MLTGARAALLALLVWLPLQKRFGLPWAEEIVLVVMFPLAAGVRLRRARLAFAGEGLFLVAAGLLGGACLVSGAANRVPPLVVALGTFDYLKALAFFWICAVLAGERTWFERTYRVLRTVALLAALCALAQEAVAFATGEGMRRLGIYRVPGFLNHPNEMGLYVAVFFLLEASRSRRLSLPVVLLWAATCCAGSRMVHAATGGLGAFLLRGRPWMLVPVVAAAAFVAATSGLTIREQALAPAPLGEEQETRPTSFRAYARERALAIWADQRALGAGPGRFGGVIALRTKSPLYERYPWDPGMLALHRRYHSLDQFPPRLLAELGIAGALCFLLTGLALFRAVWLAGDRGLLLAVLVVPILCLGSGLNQASILFTVGALAGSYAGSRASDS